MGKTSCVMGSKGADHRKKKNTGAYQQVELLDATRKVKELWSDSKRSDQRTRLIFSDSFLSFRVVDKVTLAPKDLVVDLQQTEDLGTWKEM